MRQETGPQIISRYVIGDDELSFYQKAGEQTGYGIDVIAKAGDEYQIMIPGSVRILGNLGVFGVVVQNEPEKALKYRVSEGHVRIAVTALKDQEDKDSLLEQVNTLMEQKAPPQQH